MISDMLQTIFQRQLQLRQVYLRNYERSAAVLEGEESEIRLLVLATIVELSEFMQMFNWKPWKRTRKAVFKVDTLGEFADILHFVVELAIICGFDANDVFNAYMAKADVNEARQREGY